MSRFGGFEVEAGRFTLVILAAPGNDVAQVELTYNWDSEAYPAGRNCGHLAYEVENIYETCQRLVDGGGHDQSASTRWSYGVRSIPGPDLDRATPKGPGASAQRAVDIDGKYRGMVGGVLVSFP